MNKAFVLKAKVAAYWRYDRTFPLVALEGNTRLVGWNAGGQSDVLTVTDKKMLIETEIKVSTADLRKDREKEKHYHFYLDYFGRQDSLIPDLRCWERHKKWLIRRRAWEPEELTYPVSRFYFAVSWELEKEAKEICAKLYPYAGLLIIPKSEWATTATDIRIAKHPYHFTKQPLTDDQLMHMQREMSATICRLALKLANIESES